MFVVLVSRNSSFLVRLLYCIAVRRSLLAGRGSVSSPAASCSFPRGCAAADKDASVVLALDSDAERVAETYE
jgi:hypothetical protein